MPLESYVNSDCTFTSEEVSNANWYAIYTRSRCEKKLNRALQKNKYDTFLPLVKERRQWSDRIKTVEVPLLPGYLFVNILPEQLYEIYEYPGVVNFVQDGGRPARIRKQEIEALVEATTKEIRMKIVPKAFAAGEKVDILYGPFRGFRGTILEQGNGSHIVIYMDSIDQALRVEMSVANLLR